MTDPHDPVFLQEFGNLLVLLRFGHRVIIGKRHIRLLQIIENYLLQYLPKGLIGDHLVI